MRCPRVDDLSTCRQIESGALRDRGGSTGQRVEAPWLVEEPPGAGEAHERVRERRRAEITDP
jgi:hypothetical protein